MVCGLRIQMIRRSSTLFTLLLIIAGVNCLPATARAERSLYDSKSAKLLDKHFTSIEYSSSIGGSHAHKRSLPPLATSYYFGPRSSNIRYDKRMVQAAQIAAQRARTHSTSRCWHAVKNALVDAHVVDSRPTTQYAKQAAEELSGKYGFKKTSIKDPFFAPVGSVLVYGGRGAGHVEIRTATGFVSDFNSPTPSNRPLIGVYVKSS